jgi:CheY-like chemotaxis protein
MRSKPLVLIIEDEELLSQMYYMKLLHDGYDAVIANNGEEGVKKARETKPDLILCDIMMPYKDGIAVLEELNADKELTDIPVVMLTNLSESQYVEEALQLGAVSYLVKSKIDPSDVVTKVKQVLGASGKLPLISK